MNLKEAMQELKRLILKNASFKEFDVFLNYLAFSENITNEQYNFIAEIAQASIKE